jgi:hypothetical protein
VGILVKILGRRELIAYAFTVTTCYLAITGTIGGTEFLTLMGTIIGFYFGRRSAEPDKQ